MDNHILWTEKYEPKSISELVINKDKIIKIKNWLINFSSPNEPSTIIVYGSHGIGKNVSLNILLQELKYDTKTLSSNSIKNRKIINEILNSCQKTQNIYNILTNNNITNKYALIIDDTETITLTSEKDSLLELCKYNDKNKIMPIIFISNNQHSKLISDIKKACTEYEFNKPNFNELLHIFNNITQKENIKIINVKVINSIIKYAQNDIRRLIFILQDLYLTYGQNEITVEKLQNYFNFSHKKDIDIGLYEATKEVLDNYKSINTLLDLYETEKVLLPLMIYENYHKNMYARNIINKDNILLKQLDISRRICNSISKGDVIETNIYTDQNWMNQSIHGFYTICDCSYTINNMLGNENKPIPNYNLNFSADLNKTSLKNINKKNIINLQSIILNKSLDDILYINKLIYKLINNGKIKEAHKLCKDYSIDIKFLEIIIKIDKNNDKLIISQKTKKIFC
jgi:DNA polymerase III delta prime subunit